MPSAVLILVLVWWPFHHKPAPSNVVVTPLGVVHIKDSDCAYSGDTWYFVGPDGMVGVSKDSCVGAFNDWGTNTGNFPTVFKI